MSCSGFDPAPPPRISTPPDVGQARPGPSPRVVSALVLDDAFSRRLISAPRRSSSESPCPRGYWYHVISSAVFAGYVDGSYLSENTCYCC